MSIRSRLVGTAMAVAVTAGLAGCAPLMDQRGAIETADGVMNQGGADRAMSALSRGDNAAAERYAITALRTNPKDPVALLAAGMAYQGMGRYDLARQYYEVILTHQTPGSIMAPSDAGVMIPRSIMDIARANMGAVDAIQGRNVARGVGESGRIPVAPLVGGPPLPVGEPVTASGMGRPHVAGLSAGGGMSGRVSDAETNSSGRFRILKRLLDEGLITPEEYAKRRSANLGALLPFTHTPPSQGMDRPMPGDDAVLTRLRDLAQAVEAREITPVQQAAEREMILEKLIPAQPRKVENPPLPPRDLIEAAESVGRLERLRAAGLITDAEVKKEKAAIEKSLDVQLAGQRVMGTSTGLQPGKPGSRGPMASAASAAAPTGWGLLLATAKTEEAAKSAWESIKAKFPEDLAAMTATFKKVQPGDKGVRWRVIAGPVASHDAARKKCKTLKLHRQACDPASM